MTLPRLEAQEVDLVDMHTLLVSIQDDVVDRVVGVEATEREEEGPVWESEGREIGMDEEEAAGHDAGAEEA